jgi:uncharacterized membrane protein YccC
MTAALSRLGFDPARFAFALRTAAAACLALLVAWALGLEHPQWSAMTVWAAAQPVRGMLVEKGLFRAFGTAVGVIVGVGLVIATHGHPALMVAGLSLWIGLCAGLGNVLRGFSSYGSILAGYSAAMVALLDTPHPDHILALGLDRFLTVMTGVAIAMLIGVVFTPKAAEGEITGWVRRLAAGALRDLAARLRGGGGEADTRRALLSELARLDELLDTHGAGSPRLRRAARALRALVVAQVALLLWQPDRIDADAAALLDGAADALDAAATFGDVAGMLAPVRGLDGFAAALDRAAVPVRAGIVLHRDWVGARQAALRAVVTMALVGALWLGAGWPGGAYMLLGTSVMISLFSTSDNPAGTMRFVTLGQLAGVAAALACRWLVWPQAGSAFDLVLLTLPFMLAGVLPVAHRRTMNGGFDFNLAMLLLLQPAFPLADTLEASVLTAAAVVAGPLVAWASFRLAYPADARRRRDMLIAMMVHDLQAMAVRSEAPDHRLVWRARLHHRLLHLVRWTEKADDADLAVFDGGLAVLRLGQAILFLRDRAASPRSAAVLRRLGRLAREPERAGRALDLLAHRLAPGEAGPVAEAAKALAANSGFFRRAA